VFGPTVDVDAVVAVLMGVYRLTKRQVPELTRDLFGLQMSVGAVIGCQEAASAAIAQTVEDARSYAQQQPIKHADESGWREGAGRSRAWLWTVVTTHVVVFMIHARRNAEAAKELLGDWFGVLVSDRHGAYHWWPNCRRQFCWAHLKRDIQAIVEREGESGRLGKGMLDEVERMFTWWHRVRDGTPGSRFVERMLTIHATRSRQHRHILDFMRASCSAACRNQPGPSMLPVEASVSPLRRAA
jgi:transposase